MCVKFFKLNHTLIKNREYVSHLNSLVPLNLGKVDGFCFTFDLGSLISSAPKLPQNNKATNNLEEDSSIHSVNIYQRRRFYQDFSEKVFQNIRLLLAQKEELKSEDVILSMYCSYWDDNQYYVRLKRKLYQVFNSV